MSRHSRHKCTTQCIGELEQLVEQAEDRASKRGIILHRIETLCRETANAGSTTGAHGLAQKILAIIEGERA